jgi:hypothetical protein
MRHSLVWRRNAMCNAAMATKCMSDNEMLHTGAGKARVAAPHAEPGKASLHVVVEVGADEI